MIAANFGRLFEVGFNIGILACIQQQKVAHNFGDSYRLDLQPLKFPSRKLSGWKNIASSSIAIMPYRCLLLSALRK